MGEQEYRKVKIMIDDIIGKLEILYNNPYQNMRFKVFRHILGRLQQLEMICYDAYLDLYRQDEPVDSNERNFTLEELKTYDGREGRPAYIAVNGVVYDVIDAASWAGATHFGLRAGEDVSAGFLSCHTNQEILDKLKVVGRII